MKLSNAENLHRYWSDNFGSPEIDASGTYMCTKCTGYGMIQTGDGWNEQRWTDPCPDCMGWGFNYYQGYGVHEFERDPDTYDYCKQAEKDSENAEEHNNE